MLLRLPRAAVALLAASLALSVPASAQEPSVFLLLGEDATGDGRIAGTVPSLDTWVDINGLSVATVGEDLVFHLGLEGTTTEIGSYCWMAAFEFGGKEYVGLDCYEGVAYESDNTLSSASRPSTSRGTNVAKSVVFDATGAVITIPLSAIGASVGDLVEDIYGLTYATRALSVVDTIPNAKSAAAADESLGSYRIGGPIDEAASGRAYLENLTTPFFLHAFTNATSDDYTLNFTVEWTNATLLSSAEVVSGLANVTVARNGEIVLLLFLSNVTAPADGNSTSGNGTVGRTTLSGNQSALVEGAAGNWSVTVDYDGFVGRFGLGFEAYQPPAPVQPTTANTTSATGNQTAVAADSQGAPGLGMPLVGLVLVAVAIAGRRRRC